jgi:hypothetical protein
MKETEEDERRRRKKRGGRPKGGGTRVLPCGGPGVPRDRHGVKCRTAALDSLGLSSPKRLATVKSTRLEFNARAVPSSRRAFQMFARIFARVRAKRVLQECYREICPRHLSRDIRVITLSSDDGHIGERFRSRHASTERARMRSDRFHGVAFNPRAR